MLYTVGPDTFNQLICECASFSCQHDTPISCWLAVGSVDIDAARVDAGL